jgi:hypothetical protein
MRRPILFCLVLAAVLLTGVDAAAQDPPVIEKRLVARGQQDPGPPPPDSERRMDAQATRNALQQLLWQLPPNVRRVLQLDPALLGRPDYLAPYPQLAEFLEQHPEVARNPAFFFGTPEFERRNDPYDALTAILAGIGLFIGFMTVVTLVGSVARQVVGYRRWVRQSRMQAEVHTKILDRLQSNEDLLSYVQTPAGRNFLEFAPLRVDADPPTAAAPFGRILWSVQAGVVLAALGIGLRFAQASVAEEIAPAFTVLGVIVMALGVGAIVSAIVAYGLSSRLGLLPPRRTGELDA